METSSPKRRDLIPFTLSSDCRIDRFKPLSDVRIVVLNGELDNEIYMDQSVGFITKGNERKVCSLKRSIYSLTIVEAIVLEVP